tara:strand:- start:379 stop:2061 length:1683 start_codon:yes stop_codon:yes gene_type:complete
MPGIRGGQIRDETIESVDIASGSIKMGEVSSQVISSQAAIDSVDTTNDMLLIYDANNDALKKVAPTNLGVGGSGSPGGSDTQVQFNDGGSFAGNAGLTFNKTAGSLTVAGDVSGSPIMLVDNDQSNAGHVMKLTTDGTGNGTNVLDMESASSTIFRARADGRFGFGPDGVSSMGAGTFVVGIDNSSHTSDIAISQRLQHLGDSNTYMEFPSNDNITFSAGGSEELKIASDAILVKQFIKHDGDEDTLINFSDNKIILKAGNIAMVTAEKKGSAPHEVTINDGSNNIDFVVKGNGSNQGNPGMKFDASTNKLGINGIGTPAYELEVAGDIGLAEYIYHRGDDNTFLRFQEDQIHIKAGGRSMIKMKEDTSDQVLILSGAGGATSPDPAGFDDTNFFVSGTIGSRGTSTAGTSVFGGDVFVSGTLIAGSQFARNVASINLGSGTTSTINPATIGAGTVLVTASSITTPTSMPNEMMHLCAISDGTVPGQILTVVFVTTLLTGASGPADTGALLLVPASQLNSSTGIVTIAGEAAGGTPLGATATLIWTGSAWAILSAASGAT